MIVLYLLVLFLLGIFSYSQIDLNLTLFSHPYFLWFQYQMIQLGYYRRPISTAIYLSLIIILYTLYFFLLRNSPKIPKLFFAGVCLIGLLSYPAFSHDFFNYLFDAKIVTHYGQNPYLLKALDFPADPWIRFMHWTHRTYPYGPTWLLVTLPFSFFGFGKFILTVLNFKVLFISAYLGSVYLIKKIAGNKSALFFAANPLVIIESLVSPHLDAVMAFFFLLALYFNFQKKKIWAILSLLFSGGIKYLTLITLPLFWKSKKILEYCLPLLLLALIPIILMREIYPWYFLPIIGLCSLLITNRKVYLLATAASLGLLLRYSVLLFFGQEILYWENILTAIPIIFCVAGLIILEGPKIAKPKE